MDRVDEIFHIIARHPSTKVGKLLAANLKRIGGRVALLASLRRARAQLVKT